MLLWISIGFFILSFLSLKVKERSLSNEKKHLGNLLVKVFCGIGWVLLGIYWFLQLPNYYIVENSIIKSILTLTALPLFIYFGYYTLSGEKTLIKLGYSIAVMGLIYLPFAYIDVLKTMLIEHTAMQEYRVLSLLGISAKLVEQEGIRNLFIVTNPKTGATYRSVIILACTGLGSISVFTGIIAAVNAPIRKKLKVLGVVIPIIYLLNTVRNVFITTSYGYQLFPYAEEFVLEYTGEVAGYTSFFWADKVISQSLSLFILIGLGLYVIKYLPETMTLLEETFEFLLGEEIDIKKEFRENIQKD